MRYSKEMFKNRPRAEIKDPRTSFHRCFRPVVIGLSERDYLNDDEYAQKPYSFTKAFLTLQKEIEELFLFVEPADDNRKTCSDRIQQLFIRVCIELEANFKAIMSENTYSKDSNWWDINDYWKINVSHKFSEYKVYMPNWDGKNKEFASFADWGKSPN